MVLGKGLGGEEIERAGFGILRQRVEDGEVVAECLAAGGGGGDDDVFAPGYFFPGFELMGVELADASFCKDRLERRAYVGGDRAGIGLTRGLAAQGRDRRVGLSGPGFELREGFFEGPILADERITRRGRSRVDEVKRKDWWWAE